MIHIISEQLNKPFDSTSRHAKFLLLLTFHDLTFQRTIRNLENDRTIHFSRLLIPSSIYSICFVYYVSCTNTYKSTLSEVREVATYIR